jgi:hypothetical protein
MGTAVRLLDISLRYFGAEMSAQLVVIISSYTLLALYLGSYYVIYSVMKPIPIEEELKPGFACPQCSAYFGRFLGAKNCSVRPQRGGEQVVTICNCCLTVTTWNTKDHPTVDSWRPPSEYEIKTDAELREKKLKIMQNQEDLQLAKAPKQTRYLR